MERSKKKMERSNTKRIIYGKNQNKEEMPGRFVNYNLLVIFEWGCLVVLLKPYARLYKHGNGLRLR